MFGENGGRSKGGKEGVGLDLKHTGGNSDGAAHFRLFCSERIKGGGGWGGGSELGG